MSELARQDRANGITETFTNAVAQQEGIRRRDARVIVSR
jgi:hypothetical protein